MISKIKYVYDRNNEGDSVLLGAMVQFFDGQRTTTEEIYVGLPFQLEDILESDINASVLKVVDKSSFAKRYNEYEATGVVYFPQTDRYAFLKAGDDVMLWNGDDKIDSMLQDAIAKKSELLVKDEERIKQKIHYLEELDSNDPLVELYGLSRVRGHISNR